ncbi:MAG: hypothetical protein ABEK59_08650 [Halobacteria archaeon]
MSVLNSETGSTEGPGGSGKTRLVLAVALVLLMLAQPVSATHVKLLPHHAVRVVNVDVNPEEPVEGQVASINFDLETDMGGEISVTSVKLTKSDSNNVVTRVSDMGTISEKVSMSLDAKMRQPGKENLMIHVMGRSKRGQTYTSTHPVTVIVREKVEPVVEVNPQRRIAGVENPVKVNVTNNLDRQIHSVTVTSPKSNRSPDVGTIGPFEEHTFRVPIKGELGSNTVPFHVQYEDNGIFHQITKKKVINLAPKGTGVLMKASVVERKQGLPDIRVRVDNTGNVPVSGLQVKARERGGGVISERTIRILDRGKTMEFDLGVDRDEKFVADITLEYSNREGKDVTKNTSVTYYPIVEDFVITSIRTVREDGNLRLQGTVGNPGINQLKSLELSVPDTSLVSPAQPSGKDLVGNLSAGQKHSFNLTMNYNRGNLSRIPIEVRYTVGSQQLSAETEVNANTGKTNNSLIQSHMKTRKGHNGGNEAPNLTAGEGRISQYEPAVTPVKFVTAGDHLKKHSVLSNRISKAIGGSYLLRLTYGFVDEVDHDG